MKKHFINIILLFPTFLLGQYHFDLRPVTNEVVEIKQINYNGKFRKSGWKSVYKYSNGKIIRKRNWYKGELRLDEKSTYKVNDNELIKETINKNNFKHLQIDSLSKHLIKRKIFLGNDSINPSIIFHSFLYDFDNKLISYKWTNHSHNGMQITNCSKLKYFKNKIVIQEFSNCEEILKTITIKLSNKGNPIFDTIDYHDPTTVISGGRSEKGIIRYQYKYDKEGNWIKRYYLTSTGRRILEIKRKIKYRKQHN